MARTTPRDILNFILDNSLLLLIGAGTGRIWANVNLPSYTRTADVLHFFTTAAFPPGAVVDEA